MIAFDLIQFITLALICVPLAWIAPKQYALDVVAFWTVCCLVAVSPATAIWLLLIAFGLPAVLRLGAHAKGPVATIVCVALVAGLVMSRVLPGWAWVGGAFFTLRALHIVIEWWMGRLVVPKLRESLQYFLFLPILAAGPINRFPHFQHQMRRRRWEPEMFFTGAERVLLGLVWLYFVAGRVVAKIGTDTATAVENIALFWQVWIASVVAWIELFFVFAGATHVALGISLMMGLKLEENFNRPWSARNLSDFWTRWHMTLSNWVLDYVFRPVSALTRKPVVALIAAMLVIGLWHELSVYYVLWAFWQSLGIVISRILVQRVPSGWMPNWAGMIIGPVCVLAWLSAARPVIGVVVGDLS